MTRFARFSFVGLLGAALQLALFHALSKWALLPGVAAAAISVEMAVLHNFLWHERYTWRDRECAGLRARASRFWQFHLGNGLVSLAGNTALVYCLVHQFQAPALPSAAAAIAVCAPVNFLVADNCIFRRH